MKKKSILLAGLLAAGIVLAAPLAAQAHVRVTPDAVPAGTYPVLTFRVPNESATASTNKLELTIPDGSFTSVSYQPVSGWSTDVRRNAAGLPAAVTWTASPGSGIAPGQFQQFQVSVGLAKGATEIVLPVDQTYSDGTVTSWNQTQSGATEPKNPAPVLSVQASSADTDPSPTSASTPASADSSTAIPAIVLSIIAAILALAAFMTAVIRRRAVR